MQARELNKSAMCTFRKLRAAPSLPARLHFPVELRKLPGNNPDLLFIHLEFCTT